MAKDGVGDRQDPLDFLDPARLQVEFGNHVMALALVLDAISQPSLAPGGDLLNLAPVRFDQLADPVDLLLNAFIVELRLDDVHQLIRRHANLLPLGIAPAMACAAAGAGKRRSVYQIGPFCPEIKKRPPPGPATAPEGSRWC